MLLDSEAHRLDVGSTTAMYELFSSCHGSCECGSCGTFSTGLGKPKDACQVIGGDEETGESPQGDTHDSGSDMEVDTGEGDESEPRAGVEEELVEDGTSSVEDRVLTPSPAFRAILETWVGENAEEIIRVRLYQNRIETVEKTISGKKIEDRKSVKRCLLKNVRRGSVAGVPAEISRREAAKKQQRTAENALKKAKAAVKTAKGGVKQAEAQKPTRSAKGKGGGKRGNAKKEAQQKVKDAKEAERTAVERAEVAQQAVDDANTELAEAKEISFVARLLEFFGTYLQHYFLKHYNRNVRLMQRALTAHPPLRTTTWPQHKHN